jgi:hypothetical protein
MARRWAGTCPLVPELLAARAEGDLTAADAQRLERHLGRCEGCRDVEGRFRAGEEAYRAAPDDAPAAAVLGGLVAALRAAAPNREREAPAKGSNGGRPAVKAAPAPSGTAAPATSAEAADALAGGAPTPAAEPTDAPSEPAADEPPPIAPPAKPSRRRTDSPTLSWDAADLEPGPGRPSGNGHGASRGRVITRIVVPAAIVLAAFLTGLILSGAFDGTDDSDRATPQREEQPPPVRPPPRPSVTPLPERTSASLPARPARDEEDDEDDDSAGDAETATADPAAPAASAAPGPAAAIPQPPPAANVPAPAPRRPANDGGTEAPEPPPTGGTEAQRSNAGP